MNEVRTIEANYEMSYETERSRAFNDAASQVKGMKYGLITNSALDALAYDIVSDITLRGQIKKADEQYMRELDSIVKRTGDFRKRQLVSVMYEHYVPIAMQCVDLWGKEVLQKLLEYEIVNNHKRVFVDIMKFSLENSQKMIDKLGSDASLDLKKKCLLEAFKLCPYNKSIYEKILDLGWMTQEIFEYIKAIDVLFAENTLWKETKEKCNKNLEDIDYVKRNILYYVGDSVYRQNKELKELYKEEIKNIKNNYMIVKNLHDKKKSIRDFIVCNLHFSDIKSFVIYDKEKIGKEVENYVKNIVNEKMWDIMVSNYFIDIMDALIIYEKDLKLVNQTCIDYLSEAIFEYKYEMSKIYEEYEKREIDYDIQLNIMEKELKELENEVESLSFWKKKKKQELKELILKKKLSTDEFRISQKPQLLWK